MVVMNTLMYCIVVIKITIILNAQRSADFRLGQHFPRSKMATREEIAHSQMALLQSVVFLNRFPHLYLHLSYLCLTKNSPLLLPATLVSTFKITPAKI